MQRVTSPLEDIEWNRGRMIEPLEARRLFSLVVVPDVTLPVTFDPAAGTIEVSTPVVSFDSDGDYAVAWSQKWVGTVGAYDVIPQLGVYVQVYERDGAPRGTTLALGPGTTPDVVLDDDGDVTVAWQANEYHRVYDPDAYDGVNPYGEYGAADVARGRVVAQRFDMSGAALTPRAELTSELSGADEVLAIDVALTGDGSMRVVWIPIGIDGLRDVYNVGSTDAAGTVLGVNTVAPGEPVNLLRSSSVGAGGALIRFGNTLRQVQPGVTPDAEFTFILPGADFADAGVDGAGNVVVVYKVPSTNVLEDVQTITAQRYTPTGSPIGAPVTVATARRFELTAEPRVYVAADGGFVVTWSGGGEDGNPDQIQGLYARQFDADGQGVGRSIALGQPQTGDLSAGALSDAGDLFGFTSPGTMLRAITPSDAPLSLSSDGLLSITGTSGDDTVVVRVVGDVLTVVRNGVSADFGAIDVRQIHVDALDGNDDVSLDNSVQVSATLVGGAGNDTLAGGGQRDLVDGGDGDDLVFGNFAADRVFGGIGNDSLGGGKGFDTLDGGLGADTMIGGLGNDWVSYFSRPESVTISIDGLANDGANGGAEGDNVDVTVETVSGGSGADVLRANANLPATFYGRGGNDLIEGSVFNDVLMGGDGNDTINGGIGNDTMDGGLGDDLLNGSDGFDSIDGGDGNNTLNGGLQGDTLVGGTGVDVINGQKGHDVITDLGGAGGTIKGGQGNDTVVVEADNGPVIAIDYSNQTTPIIVTADGYGIVVNSGPGNVDSITGVVQIIGSFANDTFTVVTPTIPFAEDLVYVFRGSGGNDLLDASLSPVAVRLFGDAGADTLFGGAGDDFLSGALDGQIDLIDGNLGTDIIDTTDAFDVVVNVP